LEDIIQNIGNQTEYKFGKLTIIKLDYMENQKNNIREKAMEWWNNMGLEQKFYKTIKHNDLIIGDTTRHPNTLTGKEIEIIYKAEYNIS